MKKLVMCVLFGILALSLYACDSSISKLVDEAPFKKHKVIEPATVKSIEDRTLANEVEFGLDEQKSSARIVSFTKIGNYATGKIRILDNITAEELAKVNKNKTSSNQHNGIVNYDCSFEYTYTRDTFTRRCDRNWQ